MIEVGKLYTLKLNEFPNVYEYSEGCIYALQWFWPERNWKHKPDEIYLLYTGKKVSVAGYCYHHFLWQEKFIYFAQQDLVSLKLVRTPKVK